MRYNELLSQLEQTLAFSASLNLNEGIKKSRFSNYQARIQRLCEIINKYSLEQLPQEVEQELKEENLDYVLSLTESLEFVSCVDYLKTCEPKIIRKKLASVLGGPLLPDDENTNSNEARNTLFELNLASKLRKAGLDALLGKDADIEATIDDKQVVIECKRPFREQNIGKQINKAGRQVRTRLKTLPAGSRGIVAISLSKTMNTGDKFFAYLEEASAKDTLSRKLQTAADSTMGSWKSLGKKIIGNLFHVVTASFDKKHGRYTLGEQFNAHPLAPHGSGDFQLFKHMCNALAKLEH